MHHKASSIHLTHLCVTVCNTCCCWASWKTELWIFVGRDQTAARLLATIKGLRVLPLTADWLTVRSLPTAALCQTRCCHPVWLHKHSSDTLQKTLERIQLGITFRYFTNQSASADTTGFQLTSVMFGGRKLGQSPSPTLIPIMLC